MERSQVPIVMLLSFIIFIFALVSVGIFFYESSSPTGQVVSEEVNFLNGPFELRAWVVNKAGVRLDIKNDGPKDYLITSLEVDGCGSIDFGRQIISGESRIFEVKCSLAEGTEFNGKITVIYSDSAGGESKVIEGNVKDFV